MKKFLKKMYCVIFVSGIQPKRLLWLYSNSKHNSLINTFVRYRLRKYTVSISQGAIISEQAIFPHPQNIVIGRGVRIAKGVSIYQGVTIGALNGLENLDEKNIYDKYPYIDENVTIYTNSIVVGSIHIGKRAIVGANSFVNKDVNEDDHVAGSPAKSLKIKG